MPTKNLAENSRRIEQKIDRLQNFARREITRSYARAMSDVRSTLTRLYQTYAAEGELTRAQASQFLRMSNIEREVTNVLRPYLLENEELLKELSQVSFERSFYEHAWAVDQAAGVGLQWGQIDDTAVRAAAGLSDDAAALADVLGQREAERHRRLLEDAFGNYRDDTRRWIGREVTQGVLRGESVQKVAKRIDDQALMHSKNSAITIARTETMRAQTIGSQAAFDRAAEQGVRVRQIWDATLDSRTRPEHAQMDGRARNEETGNFDTPWGAVPGPRRSGVASEDINCRCVVRPEVEGFSPEVRRIRGEGVQPYQTFSEWAQRNGITANRFGDKYDFLE